MHNFADMEGFIYFDGEFVKWSNAKIHILSQSLHYGTAVFEGLRAYNGRAFKLKEHNERLLASAKSLMLENNLTNDEISSNINDLLIKNNLKDCYIRPLLWLGSESMTPYGEDAKPHFAIAAWGRAPVFSGHSCGISLCSSEYRRFSTDLAPVQAKAAGFYMISLIEKRKAVKKGYVDALMLDLEGYIAEVSAANIFFVFDNEIHTPIADRFLNGIIDSTKEIAKNMGLK
jgi:branched-chain amino acid aminotransferase